MIDLDNTDLATLEAAIETDKGTMVVTFFPDKAPAHVRNFLELAQKGFYDGTAFHRVIRNFMVQGGCPNTKEGATGTPGTGNPGHKVPAEFNDTPHTRGVLSMARSADPNSAGSQFFIVHAEEATHLDGQYTVFGKVSRGLDVLDEIAGVDVEFGPTGERSSPTDRIAVRHVGVQKRSEGGDEEAGDEGDGGQAPGEAGPGETGPSEEGS